MSTATSAVELVRLEIPAQPAYVGVARSVVAAVAATVMGLDEDRLDDLRLAVSEACTTAVEARKDGVAASHVELVCVEADDYLEVTIEDEGQGFAPGEQEEDGYGLQLIQALVDHVSFDRTEAGTQVRLRVDLDDLLDA
jgi:serine/threonine-protein kinase RsbW